MHPFKIFTPTPIAGYAYNVDEFWNAIETHKPDAIIMDGGSTDPGPYMLGSGKTIVSRESYIRDLKPILEACAVNKIKLIISSAGGAGTNSQVDTLVGIISGISEKCGFQFLLSTIKFSEDRRPILEQLGAGKIQPCGPGPQLKQEDVTQAAAIVAQMGAEPFLQALENPDVDIIIAGRSYDPAPFAAFSMSRGVKPEPAWHMGKIVECGGLCALPKGRSIMATMYEDHFVLTPTSHKEICTPLSVAAHTFYEKTRPDRLPGPGGVLHLDDATYLQQLDGRSVAVRGSKFVPTPTYQVKLEGATMVGFRSIFIGGIRDPILIRNIDTFLEQSVRSSTKSSFPKLDTIGGPRLIFHVYGKNAIMGSLEIKEGNPHEIGVMGEVVAHNQIEADAIANLARINVLHLAYPGQLSTGGNLASPLTPLEHSLGPVYKFSIYHLMDVDNPTSLFQIENLTVGEKKPQMKFNTPSKSLPKLESQNALKPPERRQRNLNKSPLLISDVASVVRSKNSGPYEITLDIMFDDPSLFRLVQKSGVLTEELLKSLYRLSNTDVMCCRFFEPALGWKFTFKRPESQLQGSVGERDTFGAQMHAPLLDIEIPSIIL